MQMLLPPACRSVWSGVGQRAESRQDLSDTVDEVRSKSFYYSWRTVADGNFHNTK